MKNTQRLSMLLVACLLMGTIAQVAATAGRARMPVTESRPVVSPGITSNFEGPLHAKKPVTNMQDEGRALVVAPANVEARPKASFFKNPVQAIKDAWRYEPQRFEKGSTAPLGTTGFATDAMKEKAQKIRIPTASHYETQATGVSQLPKSISRWVQDKGASIQLRQAERQGLIDSQYAAKKQPAAKIEDKVAGGVTKRAIRQQFREGTLVDSTARPSADKSLLERFRTKAENAAISTARFIAPTPPRRAENASADRPAPVRVIPQGDAQAPTPPTKSRGQLPAGVQVYATKEEGQRAAAEQNAAIQARWAKQAPAASATSVGEGLVTSRPQATQTPGQPPLPAGPPPQAPTPPTKSREQLPAGVQVYKDKAEYESAIKADRAADAARWAKQAQSDANVASATESVTKGKADREAQIASQGSFQERLDQAAASRRVGSQAPTPPIAPSVAQPATPVVSGPPALQMSNPPARPTTSVAGASVEQSPDRSVGGSSLVLHSGQSKEGREVVASVQQGLRSDMNRTPDAPGTTTIGGAKFDKESLQVLREKGVRERVQDFNKMLPTLQKEGLTAIPNTTGAEKGTAFLTPSQMAAMRNMLPTDRSQDSPEHAQVRARLQAEEQRQATSAPQNQ